jgi:long-subunit acyl-CoA synthetase (AMP-forming)
VQSPALMTGDLKRDDLTAEVLQGGWFHTGDTGRIDEAGRRPFH